MNDVYVLEWSKKQNAPHVQPLEATLSKNRQAYRENAAVNDFVPLAIGSLDEMLTAADGMKPTLTKRSQQREYVTL